MRTTLCIATAIAGSMLLGGLVSGSAQATPTPVLKSDAAPGIVTLVARKGGGGGGMSRGGGGGMKGMSRGGGGMKGLSRGGGGGGKVSRGGDGRGYAYRSAWIWVYGAGISRMRLGLG